MITAEPQICRIPMTRRSVGRQIESENRGATYPSGTYRNGRAKRLGLEILVACEGRASGVSCRVRRPFGQLYTKVAVFALPTDAAGTKGGFEGETASIVAAKITLRRC